MYFNTVLILVLLYIGKPSLGLLKKSRNMGLKLAIFIFEHDTTCPEMILAIFFPSSAYAEQSRDILSDVFLIYLILTHRLAGASKLSYRYKMTWQKNALIGRGKTKL